MNYAVFFARCPRWRISQSTYKSTLSLDIKKVLNLTPASMYKSTLGWDLCLRAAGGDVHTGCVVVAEHPAACRHRHHAATCDEGRWRVVHGQWRLKPTSPAKSIAPCQSALARPPQTQCHLPSSSSTRFDGISRQLSAIDLHR